MTAKIRLLKIIAAIIIGISFTIVLLAPPPAVPAIACVVGNGESYLSADISSFEPKYMVDDAARLAAEIFGNDQVKCHDFISQLLAIYLEAKDKDVVIFINPGGWGWSSVEDTINWKTIIDGIESELDSVGYSSLVLEHYRTAHTINGCLSEFMVALDLYPTKIKDLATRIEFLTNHIPGIRIILVGESNGATICESTMHIIKGNTQVYSIEIGPSFWNKGTMSDRALVIRNNGEIPDAFSHGDLITIIRANLEALFGISQDYPGNILLYIGAPGHDYSWEYAEVRSRVTKFLDSYFKNKN